MKSYRMALGAVVEAWIHAQRYWLPDKKKIPIPVWEREELANELIEVGLAVKEEEFIYVCGIERHFDWWFRLRNGGRRGGAVSAECRRKSLDKISTPPQASSSPPNALTLTPTLTLNTKEENIVKTGLPKDLPKLAQLWNQHMVPAFSKVQSCSTKRTKAANDRWRDHPSEEFWVEVFKKMKVNQFLLGKNDRDWKANFSWIVQPDSADKVLEGNYGNKQGQVWKEIKFDEKTGRMAEVGDEVF